MGTSLLQDMVLASTSQPKYYLAALCAESLIYGAYSVLFFMTLCKILQKSSCLREFKAFHISITVVMYTVGTVHFATFIHEILTTLVIVDGVATYDNPPFALYEYTKAALEVANCLLGDVIVIWRAWKIWRECVPSRSMSIVSRMLLYATPLTLFMASGATGTVMVINCSGTDLIVGSQTADLRRWEVAWASLVLATNLVVTLAIAYESWVAYGVYPDRIYSSTTVLSLMSTLIESGLLYCCTFTALLILLLTRSTTAFVMNHIIPQLAGIYPTVAVIACNTLSTKILKRQVERNHRQPLHALDPFSTQRFGTQISISRDVTVHKDDPEPDEKEGSHHLPSLTL